MKAVMTVIGRDKPGIIAKISGMLADNEVNIEDINQTILQGNFTMVMFLDLDKCKKTLSELAETCADLGEKIGVLIHVQHEDIFNVMHKI